MLGVSKCWLYCSVSTQYLVLHKVGLVPTQAKIGVYPNYTIYHSLKLETKMITLSHRSH